VSRDWDERVPRLCTKAAHLKEEMKNAIIDNLRYAHEQAPIGADRQLDLALLR
jgi:hypothetical protein